MVSNIFKPLYNTLNFTHNNIVTIIVSMVDNT